MNIQTMPLPIIKLEVDHMRHSLSIALAEYHLQMDQYFQEAIDNFCTEENLRRIIDNEVQLTLNSVVRDAVKSWFMGSEEGQKIIKDAIAKKLREEAEYYK